VGYSSPEEIADIRERVLATGLDAFEEQADASPVRMLDREMTDAAIEHIEATRKAGDSLGGAYEIIVQGLPIGLGSYVHWDRRLDGLLAHAIVSTQAQKAVEIGDGFAAASLPGSRVHDEITSATERSGRASNRAGGIEGGVTNGMPVIIRGYMKPIPTLIKPLGTVDRVTGESSPTRYERSDVTSVPAASVVAENVIAPVLANAFLEKFGRDSISEIEEHISSGG
jgi:chorismate synthase